MEGVCVWHCVHVVGLFVCPQLFAGRSFGLEGLTCMVW